MAFPHAENWDAPAPPALPSGWHLSGTTVSTTTATSPDTITPFSSPNMLVSNTPGGGTTTLTWNTADTNGGDVVVVGTAAIGTATGGIFQLFARGNSATSSSIFYAASLSWAASSLAIVKSSSGLTTLASLAGLTLAANAWYQITFTPIGSSLSVAVQRMSDSFWLNSSGVFAAPVATALTATDGAITGSGFAGISITTVTGSAHVYTDDWDFTTPTDIVIGVAGIYTITGVAATFGYDQETVGAKGSYGITGKTATLTGAASTVGATGAYLVTGIAAPLLHAYRPSLAKGSYAITGTPAFLFEPFTLTASAGSYAIIGTTVGPTEGHKVTGVTGFYTLTGLAAALQAGGDVIAGAVGVYTISRIQASLLDAHTISGPGSYLIVGTPASFFQPFTVPGSPGAYAITGSSAALGRQVFQSGTPGVYLVTGQTATLFVDTVSGDPGPVAYHVYASPAVNDPIDYDTPIDTTSGLTYTTAPLAFPGTWMFGVRAFYSLSMLEERNIDCEVTIILDAMGHDITDRPLPPSALRAFPLAQGAIRVEWTYPPTSGPLTPVGFHVYIEIGVLSYATPVATVLWESVVANSFVANVPGFIGGTTYTVGVRAYNATAEETNTNTVAVTAIATGPTAVTDLVGIATSKGA
jgi:hypothetical protein